MLIRLVSSCCLDASNDRHGHGCSQHAEIIMAGGLTDDICAGCRSRPLRNSILGKATDRYEVAFVVEGYPGVGT